ncbi:MAG: hypothetical protein NT001_05115 [Candidatus Woesearchaeota archaeon]|nr:hypothetical protein [Candidatus Woesearchaeota archaeon]
MSESRSLEQILNDKIAYLQEQYQQDGSLQKKHMAGRFRECYDRHYESAVEKFKELYGENAIPVLIGKHFSWTLIKKAAEYGSDVSYYAGLLPANNPQQPSDEFIKEWGDMLSDMEKELDTIAIKLKGEYGPKDYIAWIHEQSASKQPKGTVHVSIYGPKEINEAGDFDDLFELTCKYIANL